MEKQDSSLLRGQRVLLRGQRVAVGFEEADPVNHPSHYTRGTIQPIDFIEAQNLGFHEANIIKYVTRYKHKNGLEDLKKAAWYLERLIEKVQKA